MPSFYQGGKFERNLEKLKRKRIARQNVLTSSVAKRTKNPLSGRSMEVGRKIKESRISAGLTQLKLAGIVGTSQEAIAKIEAGRHNLTLRNLEKITKALNKNLLIELK